jgi:cyclophilin family peptidyl-prolyl cis-trans isomerase
MRPSAGAGAGRAIIFRMARLRFVPALAPLAALLALGACSTTGPPPAAPVPRVRPVEIPDLEIRALLLLLVDRQTYESYTVDSARAGDAALRRQLATTLGRVGDRRGLAVLEELAVDDAVEVRRAAAFALGQLGAPAAARALRRAAADEDRRTGILACEALARLGVELAAVVAAGERLGDAELEARLLPALWRFPDMDVVRRGERGLARAEPEMRRQAAFALTRNPRREAVPILRQLLADRDPVIRAWAARAVGRVGDGGDLARLQPLLGDPEPGPRIRALGAAAGLLGAGRAAPADDWRPLLLALLDTPHPGVRLAAVETAGRWLLDGALGDRLVVLAREGGAALRRAALLALAEGAEPRAAREMLAAAASSSAADRAAAAAAAGILGETALARRLAADGEPRVRQAALTALLAMEAEQAATLAAGLADPDPGVRAATVAWLVDTPLVPVMDLLGPLGGERHVGDLPELPLLGIRAIVARVGAAPEELEAAAFALERYAGGGSHLLRRAAADALVELGRTRPPAGSVDTGRRVADYERIVEQTWQPREIELETEHGPVRLRLACREAPLNCLNLMQLVELGFYDGSTFHRVVPDFVVQGGDPRADGWGGAGYTVRDEVGPAGFGAGTLGMALGGADTGGSQFFITLSPQPHLDGSFTAFGRVVGGWQALERISAGDRILSATVGEVGAWLG